jgi:hypothetical protein
VWNWGRGAEGERKTAAAIGPLLSEGWRVEHDRQERRGNIDHVLVGPDGAFVLETKFPRGTASVEDGVLVVQLDEERSYRLDVRPRVLGQAAKVADELAAETGARHWVQAVVVVWAEFPQGPSRG